MLRVVDPSPSLALAHPQLPDLMRPLPQHMVWMGLDTVVVVHYIKFLLISGNPIVEGAPTPTEHLSL